MVYVLSVIDELKWMARPTEFWFSAFQNCLTVLLLQTRRPKILAQKVQAAPVYVTLIFDPQGRPRSKSDGTSVEPSPFSK